MACILDFDMNYTQTPGNSSETCNCDQKELLKNKKSEFMQTSSRNTILARNLAVLIIGSSIVLISPGCQSLCAMLSCMYYFARHRKSIGRIIGCNHDDPKIPLIFVGSMAYLTQN